MKISTRTFIMLFSFAAFLNTVNGQSWSTVQGTTSNTQEGALYLNGFWWQSDPVDDGTGFKFCRYASSRRRCHRVLEGTTKPKSTIALKQQYRKIYIIISQLDKIPTIKSAIDHRLRHQS